MLECTHFTQEPTRSLWSLRRTHSKCSIFCFTTDFQLNIVVKPILKTVLSFRVKLPNPAQQDKSTTMIVGLLILTDSFYYESCLLLLLYYSGILITWIYMNYVKPDQRKVINSCPDVTQLLLVVKAFSVILSFINKAVSIIMANHDQWNVLIDEFHGNSLRMQLCSMQ